MPVEWACPNKACPAPNPDGNGGASSPGTCPDFYGYDAGPPPTPTEQICNLRVPFNFPPPPPPA